MRRVALSLLLLSFAGLPSAHADLLLPHMGRLLSPDDQPVEGTRTLRFSLHRQGVDSGGPSLFWEETYPNVEVKSGIYSVLLGDESGGRAPLSASDLADANEVWLQVTVFETSADTTGVALQPRLRLATSLVAEVARDARLFGGLPPEDYLRRAEFEQFRSELSSSDPGGVSIPWSRLSGVPAGLEGALREVTTTGPALGGRGTTDAPLHLNPGGVETAALGDGAVTNSKIAPGAVSFDKLATMPGCGAGSFVRWTGSGWECGSVSASAPLSLTNGVIALSDGGVVSAKLADGAVSAAKLANDAGGLSKVSGGVMRAEGGSIGVGVASPAYRLDVGTAGSVSGVGSARTTANSVSVVLTGGTTSQLSPGDRVSIGSLGTRYVSRIVNSTTFEHSSPPLSTSTNSEGLSFTILKPTARVSGNSLQGSLLFGDMGHGAGWGALAHSGATGTQSYALRQNESGNSTFINKKSGGGLIGLRVDDIDQMVINDAGNVGIGTTNPMVKLDVAGVVRTTDLQISGGNQGSNFVRVGNVQWSWGSVGCSGVGNIVHTITLPAAFADTSYSVSLTPQAIDNSGYRSDFSIRQKSPGSFAVASPAGSGTTNCFDWTVVGRWR